MTRGRTDDNQTAIMEALRRVGARVQDLSQVGKGCPDLLVGFRGVNYLLEVKDSAQPPNRRQLTKVEAIWHEHWRGTVAVVESVVDALRTIGAI